MSRDSNGTYSLPAGNPVITGTVISSTWANSTMSDISAALTDSLSRTGLGGMSSPLKLAAGSSALPGLTWGLEPSSGFYREAAGDFRWVISTTEVMTLTSSIVNFPNGALQYGGIEVGYRGLPLSRAIAVTGALVQTDNGKKVTLSGSTFTLSGAALTAGTTVLIMNLANSSKTLAPGSGTLNWLNGSGSITAGNRTLAIGGVATMHFDGTNWYVWGTGLT